MLAIFGKGVANPPEELKSPAAAAASFATSHGGAQKLAKHPEEILRVFHSSHLQDSVSTSFGGGAALAYSPGSTPSHLHQRLFCGYDEMYCLFFGRLDNLSALIRQYGLWKGTDEAMMVIEAYRTLRDRGPYPADQVLKDLSGSFAFILYDKRDRCVFASLGTGGSTNDVTLYWGLAADGSLVLSDQLDILKAGCGKSFAPFPPGCMFHSEVGLTSFEHPMNKMKAMPRVDSEGVMCGATFKVDTYSRVKSMPRVGSEANWSAWATH